MDEWGVKGGKLELQEWSGADESAPSEIEIEDDKIFGMSPVVLIGAGGVLVFALLKSRGGRRR
jgi:hypothetical protein